MNGKRGQNRYLMLLIGLTLAVLTGCSSKTATVNDVKESGIIKVGVCKNSIYTEESNYLSETEQALIEKICKELESEPEYYVFGAEELEEKLASDEIDAAIGTLSGEYWYGNKKLGISEVYERKFLFVVTVRGDYSSTIKALSDRNAGVLSQVSEGSKQQMYQADHVTLVMYDSAEDAAEDLKTNVISAFLCYQEQAEMLALDEAFQIQDLRGVTQEEYCVLTRAGREDLLAVINEAIRESE